MWCFALNWWFELFWFFYHMNNILILASTISRTHWNCNLALFNYCSGIYNRRFTFSYWHWFTCHWSLIYHCFPGNYFAIKRNYIADSYSYIIACLNFIWWNKYFLSVFYKPYLSYIKRHASGKVVYGFLMCPLFKNFTYAKQKHYWACCCCIIS